MNAQFIFCTPVGNFSSDFLTDLSDVEMEEMLATAKSFVIEGKFVSMTMEGGNTMFLPGSILKNSVVIVNEVRS